jgi:acetolactate synthase-1/2/3 large subunit
MTVAEYIAKFLADNGMNDVFCMDGAAAAQMIVAVANEPRLNYYCNWHEQAGGFAADGYFRSSGRMSTMISTSGPAAQNLCNPIATAWYDSIPVLFITGNINSMFMKPNNYVRQHGFQEHDVVSMVKGFTKYAVQIKNASQIKFELEKAIILAKSGRPGPVLLDIPMDIQKKEIDETKLVTSSVFHEKQDDCFKEMHRYSVEFILEEMYKAKRPLILIGGGVKLSKAEANLRVLLNCLHVPFAVTWNMIDFAESNDPLYAGRVGTFGGDGRNFAIQNCDFLLVMGSRISGRITGGMINSFARDAYRVIVDIDVEELQYQPVKGDLNLAMDAKKFIDIMTEIFAARAQKNYIENDENEWLSTKFNDWTNQVIEWRNKYRVYNPEYEKQKDSVNPYVFIKELSKQVENDSVIVTDIGSNCVVTHQCWDTKLGQIIFSNNGNASLGYALPAAIGAAIANPDKQIICIVGDGGLNFNIQELQTIRTYNLNIKIFVFNNDCYGMTKAYRDTNCNSNYAGCDREHGVVMPDFCEIAYAYGLYQSFKIYNHKHLALNIDQALNFDSNPLLCDVNMKGFFDYIPKINFYGPIEDMYPFLPRDEIKANMIIDPIEGWEGPTYPGHK